MTRTFAELLAALDADAFDVYQPDVVLAAGMLRTRTIAELALARNRWFTPHTWTNGIGLLANLHVAAGVGGGPFLEFPYDPPGWTPERRDFMLAEPIRPGPDGVLRVPAAPGSRDRPRRGRDPAVRGMTATDARAAGPTAEDWIARAAAIAPRTELFIDGRVRPGRLRPDLRRHHRPRRLDDRRTSPRAAARTSTGRWPRPGASFDDGRWADQPPADRKRVLLRLAELIREQPRRARPARVARRRQADPRHAPGRRPESPATTIQWYAETIDKVYGEVGPTGPDALSLVTREPIGVVAAIVPWNYPLIITAWKLGRGARRPATRSS